MAERASNRLATSCCCKASLAPASAAVQTKFLTFLASRPSRCPTTGSAKPSPATMNVPHSGCATSTPRARMSASCAWPNLSSINPPRATSRRGPKTNLRYHSTSQMWVESYHWINGIIIKPLSSACQGSMRILYFDNTERWWVTVVDVGIPTYFSRSGCASMADKTRGTSARRVNGRSCCITRTYFVRTCSNAALTANPKPCRVSSSSTCSVRPGCPAASAARFCKAAL
mmetsp:Transcript_14970/g.43197  ORF Transcript_14970/g.43197 Transcript_14970/m.43197 type:complete len:229 (+) Transcript_14970:545-1231(+)